MEELLNIRELRTANLVMFARDMFEGVHNRNRYIGQTILPNQTVGGLDFEILQGASHKPVMASIHAMGAESGIGSRRGQLKKLIGSIPNIKRKIGLEGKTLYQLKTQNLMNDQLQALVSSIYDDTENMVAAVAARIEWLRWKALSYGTFTYSEDGVIVSVDFQVPAVNTIDVYEDTGVGFGGAYWDDLDTANWVADLMVHCDMFELTYGVRPERAVCSRKVMNYLLRNVKVAEMFVFGADFPSKIMTATQFNSVRAEYGLPNFVTYDVMADEEDLETGALTTTRFLPESRVILLPPAGVEVGSTLFAPTLDSLTAAEGLSMKDAPGIWAKVWTEGNDTPVGWTKAEANAFPTLPGAQFIGIMKVLSEA